MKPAIRITAILLMTFLFFVSARQMKNDPIHGTWKLSSGQHDGNAAPQFLMDRIQSFNRDKTFESHVRTDNGMVKTNSGVFYIINDTTLVTYHHDLSGKLENIANTYNFHIKKDSMHFYGFYLRQLPQNNVQLIKVYIDEWWVKTKM